MHGSSLDDQRSDATDQLQQARDALDDARVLLEHGGTAAGVLNRSYYAAFHAAQAALYARGETPTSHGHVRQQFGQHVVLEGDASREDGRLLGRLYDYRQEADYRRDTPSLDLESLVGDVEAFVDNLDDLVRDGTPDRSTGLSASPAPANVVVRKVPSAFRDLARAAPQPRARSIP